MSFDFLHGYSDAKYGFTYVSGDIEEYTAGYKSYLEETKNTQKRRMVFVIKTSGEVGGVDISAALLNAGIEHEIVSKYGDVEDDYIPQPDEMPTHYQDESAEWHDELDELLK